MRPATRRLLPRAWPAVAVLVASLAVFVTLALLVHDKADTRLDHGIYVRVRAHVPDWFVAKALHLTDPSLIVTLFIVVVIAALLLRHWTAVVLAVTVPLAGVLLTEHVLKPWVHRTDTGYLAFPSGHETGVASFACVAGVLLLASRSSVLLKVVGLAVLAADVALAALALVGSDYHYATDTVGSLALCLVLTTAVALALDGVTRPERATAQNGEAAPFVHSEVGGTTPGRATV